MFDIYVNRLGTEYVDRNITLNENRAPTDESVKLLNEMSDKALKNIVKTFSTTNNTLQITAAVYEDHRLQERAFLCKFVLNGKEHKLKVDIPTWKYNTPDEMVSELYTQICGKLAVEIMQPLLREMNKGFYK
jgi:hypothetical protein